MRSVHDDPALAGGQAPGPGQQRNAVAGMAANNPVASTERDQVDDTEKRDTACRLSEQPQLACSGVAPLLDSSAAAAGHLVVGGLQAAGIRNGGPYRSRRFFPFGAIAVPVMGQAAAERPERISQRECEQRRWIVHDVHDRNVARAFGTADPVHRSTSWPRKTPGRREVARLLAEGQHLVRKERGDRRPGELAACSPCARAASGVRA